MDSQGDVVSIKILLKVHFSNQQFILNPSFFLFLKVILFVHYGEVGCISVKELLLCMKKVQSREFKSPKMHRQHFRKDPISSFHSPNQIMKAKLRLTSSHINDTDRFIPSVDEALKVSYG